MTTSQFDRDATMFNRKYAVRDLALEIMRQDSWLTLLEATKQAEAFIDEQAQKAADAGPYGFIS